MIALSRRSLLTLCALGLTLLCAPPADAALRAIGYVQQNNGDITFYVGDDLSTGVRGSIAIDNLSDELGPVITAFTAVQFLPPAEWNGLKVQSNVTQETAFSHINTWQTVTIPLASMPPGDYSVNVAPGVFDLAGGFTLPWTIQIGPFIIDSDGDGIPDEDDPKPFNPDITTLTDLAVYIFELAGEPAILANDDLQFPILRLPLRNRLAVVASMVQTFETTEDPDEAQVAGWFAVNEIDSGLLPKMDSFLGGNPNNDWIVDHEVQELFYTELKLLSEFLKSRL
jgi:hypothetical protein